MITEIIDLPAEIVLWMIYVKKFDPIKQKYKVKLRFDPKFIYFEATHNTQLYQVRQAAQEAYKVGTQDYELRFLMKDTKLIFNYHLYIKMIKTQEYKDLTKRFDGLCIMVKDKFIKLQHELSENAGYRGDVKMSLPNSYVLAWMPRNKANHIVSLLNSLLYSTTSLSIKSLDAVWLSQYVEDLQKAHNCPIEFQQTENVVELKLPSTNIKDSVQQLFQQHSLLQIPYELDEVQFDHKDIESLLKRKCNANVQLWTQQKVIQIAQKIDQKYCTNIQAQILQLSKAFRHSLYVFGRPEQENQSILILRNYIEQRMQNGQESIIKDYVIVTETNGFQLHFYNKQVGLQLVNNQFDQNDFDQFLAQNYNLPYEVKVHKADSNLLSFFVKVLSNQREIKSIIIEMLYGYINHSFYYIVDDIKLPNIGQQFNCKIETFRSNTHIRGLVDIYGFESQQIEQNNLGSAVVIKVSNLLHSKKSQIINYFNEQLKSDIYQQMANDKQMSQITKTCDGYDEQERCKILQFTQSQLQIIKQHKLDYQILKQSDYYLEDSFFVAIQFRGNQLSQAIDHIKSQEKYYLQSWASDKEIIEIEKAKNYDVYQVYIEEFFLDYYSNVRQRLLNIQDSEITMERQQVQFYIEITKLNVPIYNLGPIITVIQQIYKVGYAYNQLNELQPGRYLLGFALTNAKEVQLHQHKFIIRKIAQIYGQ